MAEYSGIPTAPDAPEIVSRPPQETVRPGQIIANRYEVVSRLGAGGMGAVFRVHDQVLDEFVALKVISSTLLGDARSIERMRAEVKLARKITHPNVCRVFDVGEDHGLIFLTMELVEGTTLRHALVAKTILPEKAEEYFRQIVAGVAAAHEQGVVHRDLKPENILLRKDERCVVADFGLAQGLDSAILQAGEKAGTLAYMSPEQKRGDPLDVRSDVYALGLIGCELLGDQTSLTDVLTKALAERPEDRQATAGELAVALEKVPGTLGEQFEKVPGTLGAPAPLVGTMQGDSDAPNPIFASAPKNASNIQPLPVPSKSRRPLVAAVIVIFVATISVIYIAKSKAPESKELATVPISVTSASNAPADRALVVVLPFEDLAHQAASLGFTRSAPESIRAALRTMPDVSIVEGESLHGTGATFSVRGNVQLVGERLRLFAQLEPIGKIGDVPSSEPVEVDVAVDAGAALEALRSKLLDEARIVLSRFRRWQKAEAGTSNSIARDKLQAYYRLIGPSPRSEHHEPGLRLLNEAIAADSDYVPARVERAYLRVAGAGNGTDDERQRDALVDLDVARRVNAADADEKAMRCRVLQVIANRRLTDESIAQAVDACQQALILASTSAHVYVALARLFDRRCEDERAMRALERAVELDRSISARALVHLVGLALQNKQVAIADRASLQLMRFQEEQKRLGQASLGHRAGAPEARGVYVFRGGVLLELGQIEEAKLVFSSELAEITETRGNRVAEATALRGLLRVAKMEHKSLSRAYSERLETLEAAYVARVKTAPDDVQTLARSYRPVDADAAAEFIARLDQPRTCEDSMQRARIFLAARRDEQMRRVLRACVPTQEWERSCLKQIESQAKND